MPLMRKGSAPTLECGAQILSVAPIARSARQIMCADCGYALVESGAGAECVRLAKPLPELIIDVVRTSDTYNIFDLAGRDDVGRGVTRRIEAPDEKHANSELFALDYHECECCASGQDDRSSQRFDLDVGRQ